MNDREFIADVRRRVIVWQSAYSESRETSLGFYGDVAALLEKELLKIEMDFRRRFGFLIEREGIGIEWRVKAILDSCDKKEKEI